jgi:hypothetical protein
MAGFTPSEARDTTAQRVLGIGWVNGKNTTLRKKAYQQGINERYACLFGDPRLGIKTEYIRSVKMKYDENVPKQCPACKSYFVTGTLYGWVCADCGATKESPVSRKK